MAAGIKAHHIREQDAVCPPVRDVEPCAKRMRHAMIEAQPRVGKRDPSHTRCVVHFLPRLQIVRLSVRRQPDRAFRHGVCKIRARGAYIGFDRVRKDIDAGIRCDGGRDAYGKLRIQHRNIRKQLVIDKAALAIIEEGYA